MDPHETRVDHDNDLAQLREAISADVNTGFGDLVRSYGPVVYSVAFRLTHSATEAEDLSSECFLRAFRALRGFPRDRVLGLEPRAWLLTILLNTWRNGLRNKSRQVAEVRMAETPEQVDSTAGVEELVLRRETSDELRRLLSCLPPAQRAAVVLRHIVGLPIAEISIVLECGEGTTKSHVSRGMATLRRLYERQLQLDRAPDDSSMVCPS